MTTLSQTGQALASVSVRGAQTLLACFDSRQHRAHKCLRRISFARQLHIVNRLTLAKIAHTLLIVFSMVASFLLPPMSAMAADLTVIVDNIKSADGTVRVGLFNTQDGFPKKAVTGLFSESKPGALSFVFHNLEPGNYAISAFHDVNKNQKLDTNFFGKPVEPYGFSRSARGKFGPPSFDDAQFKMDAHPKSISITLK